jgi:hypothetical protein
MGNAASADPRGRRDEDFGLNDLRSRPMGLHSDVTAPWAARIEAQTAQQVFWIGGQIKAARGSLENRSKA